MTAFFPDVLDEFLSASFLKGVRKKFHYDEAQAFEMQKVAEEMLPLMREEAFWKRQTSSVKNQHQKKESTVLYEQVVMSLGKGIDCLQEKCSESGHLTQSYMIEVLASELLLRGYAAYNQYIKTNTNRHVARYHFPGSEEAFPLEALADILKELAPHITFNSAFCMMPKKSAAFIAELTQDDNIQCEGICVGCNNIKCSNRMADDDMTKKRLSVMTDMPLPYGYSRILGVF